MEEWPLPLNEIQSRLFQRSATISEKASAVNSSLTLSEAVTFQRCKQWGRQGDELRPRAPTCRPGSRQAGLTHWHRIQALAMSLPVLLKTRPTRENMEGV